MWPMCSTPPPTGKADRKSTRLNSSHLVISYAVFCLKKKNNYSTVIFGDYVAEPNHVLPTAGTARYASALGTEDFVFFFYCNGDPRALHSFPTRRSSDLTGK